MAKAADRETFHRSVLPHTDAAYNLARYLLREESDAHDVVQESLMRAWRSFDTFRGGDGLPWFLQIVRNAAYTLLRSRKPTQSLPEDFPIEDDGISNPASEIIARADAQMVRDAVDQLPDIYREAIVLRELEGLSYKEIMVITGASMGTVMSRISRARRQLEQSLMARAEK